MKNSYFQLGNLGGKIIETKNNFEISFIAFLCVFFLVLKKVIINFFFKELTLFTLGWEKRILRLYIFLQTLRRSTTIIIVMFQNIYILCIRLCKSHFFFCFVMFLMKEARKSNCQMTLKQREWNFSLTIHRSNKSRTPTHSNIIFINAFWV